jgi:hypothetical protein
VSQEKVPGYLSRTYDSSWISLLFQYGEVVVVGKNYSPCRFHAYIQVRITKDYQHTPFQVSSWSTWSMPETYTLCRSVVRICDWFVDHE